MFKPSSVKKCLAYFNLDIEKINKVYAFLDNIFSNLEEKLNDKYPDYVFYKFNNEIIAKYDKENNSFYYHYYKIYEVLSSEFGLNEIKINELIVGKVEEHLKIRGVTPISPIKILICMVEEHLKIRGVTPKIYFIVDNEEVEAWSNKK